MKYNKRFSMQDLFMNKELTNLFPQFTRKDRLQNVYSFDWINKKVEEYLKNTFNGYICGDEIIINGKFKDRFNQIKGLQELIENMFNNMPSITKNIRKNTKLITPFQSIEQLKQINDTMRKIQIMQIIFDNLNYNPDFQSENRLYKLNTSLYLKKQEKWLTSVGYFNFRR